MSHPSPAPSKPRGLPWFPIVVVALALGGVGYVRSLPEFERNLKGWLSAGIPILAAILVLIWFLASRRFASRTRLMGLGLVLLLGVGFNMAVKVDGTVDGTGLPKLVWKWSKTTLPELLQPTAPATAAATPDNDPRLADVIDVPQFFGSQREGRVTVPPLATDWTANPPKQLWRQAIGAGWSSFAVVQGRAYTQEQRGEEECVTCYDLLTGKLLWSHADKAHFSQWQGGDGPRATPTVQDGRVYAYGATGWLNCLDATTGRSIWQRSVLEENQLSNIEWGLSASPLVVDEHVVVTGGNPKGPILFAYDRQTGVPVWKAGDDQASYASPQGVTLAGKRVILSNNARSMTVYDTRTGKVLLDHAWGIEKWPKASQVVVIGDRRLFLSAGYGMGCQLVEVTLQDDDTFKVEEVWSGLKMKTQFNSPARLGEHLYGLDDGRLACIEIATGERLWKEGRFASGQTLLVNDLVLVQSESGPVHLCAAKPQGYQEFGKIEALSSKTWNHPVLAGRFLLVRNDREAVCYELPVAH